MLFKKQVYKCLFSTKNALKSPLLTRDFIYDRLYNSSSGYFCKDNIQIGELQTPINFTELIGFEDYQKILSERYPKNAWLTPSEIFKPYYGMSIGNYIHQNFDTKLKEETQKQKIQNQSNLLLKRNKKIRIIEVGAGHASACESILNFFKNYEHFHYQNMEYTIVEISPQMCKKAALKLKQDHQKLLERGQIKIINEDFLNYKVINKNEEYYVIFLEVLDNMPHDRVYEGKYESLVQFSDQFGNENLKEIQQEIKDDLIKEIMEYYNSLPEIDHIEEKKYSYSFLQNIINIYYRQKRENVFVPTFFLKTLKHIKQNIPNHKIILSDFDSLNQKEQIGKNAPIVSKKLEKSHEKLDYDTYLVKRGEADIFFPTNFRFIQHMYKQIMGKNGMALKSYQFMNLYSRQQWTETKSGYNPLKEDFGNTSFFITEK
ncbi:hypothetical protein IMG5_195690 [Ichthyophthirius multifiliis]|uniref:Protein arginine methyltransferase NDUFAF7 n=1 Tax=Ichthyophthirius multifiliis TaxID=5932 RepID=G0R4Z4_ICHMU|nr:hypothetical protein IMG5_195690 [Ichthyophthirius multifiliis]EGR27457.1 hypothetical protein IMG5_195690 [Ichthyophthirius multifiliis]|eukprot:XP_004024367.1 hypothetical protein IMG5_195690 [Ichthyophthirius multifiliis]